MENKSWGKLAALMAGGLGLILCGCSTSSSSNATPPTPDQFAQRIKDNPHMSQAQKDAALEKIQGNQEAGSKRTAAKSGAGKPADKTP